MFWIITIAVIACDLVSKYFINDLMFLETNEHVIPGLIDFNYIHNDGAAWGMLGGKQILLIILTSAIMLAIIGYVIVQGKKISVLERISLALVVGGGIGNLVGRITDGYVIDFIKFAFYPDFPRFNVADIAITVGCVLLLISVLKSDFKPEKKSDGEIHIQN